MIVITNTYNSNSILENAYQGARNGAVKGAMVGTYIISCAVFSGVFTGLLEKGNRAIGNDPKWPALEGDCQLQQFRNLSGCINGPLFDSLTSFTVYVVGGTTACGMLIGAVTGAAKSVFPQLSSK